MKIKSTIRQTGEVFFIPIPKEDRLEAFTLVGEKVLVEVTKA
jgi:hypothetical protein